MSNSPDPVSSGDYPQNAAQQDAAEHTEYEMIFEAEGILDEVGGLGLQLQGPIRVIQGPRSSVRLTDDTLVYAFLSVDNINLPLLPDQAAKRLAPLQFEFSIPQRTFVVTLEEETPDEIADAFLNVLKWFCQWPQSAEAFETVEPASVPASDAAPKKKSSLDGVADKGVAFVERIGNRINEAVERKVQTQMEAASESEQRKVPTGGKVTRTVLGGARKVVSGGAQVASKVSDKTSNVVGSALGSNPVMKNLRNAPDDSSRRKLHDTLISGMAAVGRVYVAADEKGKLIINTAGQGSAEVVAQRFGDDAATAVRDTARIAYDGYRIVRFPTKLGASALLKGAAKASLSRHSHSSA